MQAQAPTPDMQKLADDLAAIFGGLFDKIKNLVMTDSTNKEALAQAIKEAETAKSTLSNYDASVVALFTPLLDKGKEALTYASASTPPTAPPEVPVT